MLSVMLIVGSGYWAMHNNARKGWAMLGSARAVLDNARESWVMLATDPARQLDRLGIWMQPKCVHHAPKCILMHSLMNYVAFATIF